MIAINFSSITMISSEHISRLHTRPFLQYTYNTVGGGKATLEMQTTIIFDEEEEEEGGHMRDNSQSETTFYFAFVSSCQQLERTRS